MHPMQTQTVAEAASASAAAAAATAPNVLLTLCPPDPGVIQVLFVMFLFFYLCILYSTGDSD